MRVADFGLDRPDGVVSEPLRRGSERLVNALEAVAERSARNSSRRYEVIDDRSGGTLRGEYAKGCFDDLRAC
jgi:hypothetical protein